MSSDAQRAAAVVSCLMKMMMKKKQHARLSVRRHSRKCTGTSTIAVYRRGEGLYIMGR